MKKFYIIYVSVFVLISLGTGIRALVSEHSAGLNTFLFGLAFSLCLLLTTWFSYWLYNHYKQIDKKAKEMTIKK